MKHIEKIICIFKAHKHDYLCSPDICCPSPHCAEQIMVSPLHYRPSTYWTTRMTTTMIMTIETMMMMMFLLHFVRVSLNIELTKSHNSWNAPSLKFKFSTLSYFFNFNILQKSKWTRFLPIPLFVSQHWFPWSSLAKNK